MVGGKDEPVVGGIEDPTVVGGNENAYPVLSVSANTRFPRTE